MLFPRKVIAAFCCIFLCLTIVSMNKPVSAQVFPVNNILTSDFLQNFNTILPFSGSFSGWPQIPSSPSLIANPVGLVDGLPIDVEFGAGASQITRFLMFRYGVKMVMQINQFESSPGKPYGLHNLINIINDYEITNGARDYRIVAINHGPGAIQLLNRKSVTPHPDAMANVYQEVVEDLMAKGVQFYMCMNTARSMGIKTVHLIPGVQFVTSAPTAIVDFQRMDYKYIQP